MIVEMRTYTYAAGDLKKIQADWEAAIPFRQTLSPVAAGRSGRRAAPPIW